MVIPTDTVERIFQLLDKFGAEQKKFVELIGSTGKIVSKWRTSGLKPYRKYFPQIAEILGTIVDYLLSGDEKKPAPTPGSGDRLDRDAIMAAFMGGDMDMGPEERDTP